MASSSAPGLREFEFLEGENAVGLRLTCKAGQLPVINALVANSPAARKGVPIGSSISAISYQKDGMAVTVEMKGLAADEMEQKIIQGLQERPIKIHISEQVAPATAGEASTSSPASTSRSSGLKRTFSSPRKKSWPKAMGGKSGSPAETPSADGTMESKLEELKAQLAAAEASAEKHAREAAETKLLKEELQLKQQRLDKVQAEAEQTAAQLKAAKEAAGAPTSPSKVAIPPPNFPAPPPRASPVGQYDPESLLLRTESSGSSSCGRSPTQFAGVARLSGARSPSQFSVGGYSQAVVDDEFKPGHKWINMGEVRPTSGTEIFNSKLAVALQQRSEFIENDLMAFGITELAPGNFIKVAVPDDKPSTPTLVGKATIKASAKNLYTLPSPAKAAKRFTYFRPAEEDEYDLRRDVFYQMHVYQRFVDGLRKRVSRSLACRQRVLCALFGLVMLGLSAYTTFYTFEPLVTPPPPPGLPPFPRARDVVLHRAHAQHHP